MRYAERAYNKKLLKTICKEYRNSSDTDEKAFVGFLRAHMKWSDKLFDIDYAPAFIFGGEWTLEYLNRKYDVDYSSEYPCAYYHGKKLYLSSEMPHEEVTAYLRSIEVEQDPRSPHCYFPSQRSMDDLVVVDVGGAEGNFAIDHIDEIRRLYIFESDSEWIEPLHRTYEPWKDKVEIIQCFVGDGEDNTVRLDDFFEERGEHPDLIKIDVEGNEAGVLRGLQNIITSTVDLRLLVCLYHSGNDEEEIKALIPEYDCSIRDGRMFYLWEVPIVPPYLRHGVAEFTKSK